MTERREAGGTSLKQHRAGQCRSGSLLQEVPALQKRDGTQDYHRVMTEMAVELMNLSFCVSMRPRNLLWHYDVAIPFQVLSRSCSCFASRVHLTNNTRRYWGWMCARLRSQLLTSKAGLEPEAAWLPHTNQAPAQS